jgi:pimeloyl-ACP methyl ester carboxylesterase
MLLADLTSIRDAIAASRPVLAAGWPHQDCLTGKPSLLLWGERDPAFGRAYRQRLVWTLPLATVVPLPGTGHFSPEDAPAAIATALADWHAGGTSGR